MWFVTLRPLLTAALLLTLLFAACIGLIHAQSYDDSGLRAFLAPPEGCPAPCFMGIRPGVTTVEEAIAVLEAHEWIDTVSRYEITEGLGVASLTASWSGAQDEWIDDALWLRLEINNNVVQRVYVDTRIPLGDIHLLLGTPELSQVFDFSLEVSAPTVGYYGSYDALDMFFMAVTYCPVKQVWTLPVEWVLVSEPAFTELPESHDVPPQIYQVCRKLMGGE